MRGRCGRVKRGAVAGRLCASLMQDGAVLVRAGSPGADRRATRHHVAFAAPPMVPILLAVLVFSAFVYLLAAVLRPERF